MFDSQQLTAELWEHCASIRVVVSDVDGTLTDGGMFYTAEGEVMKRFSVHDGMGVMLLKSRGIEVVLMTSDDSGIAIARGSKLGLTTILEGVRDKSLKLQGLAASLHVSLEEIAFIGDDVNDEFPLQHCGISACPSDAVVSVRQWVDYVCQRRGGDGAFREFAELLLAAKNMRNIL